MTKFPAILLALLVCIALVPSPACAEEDEFIVRALSEIIPGTISGKVDYSAATGMASGTNGIYVSYKQAMLMADSASINTLTGDVEADGHVRIESGDMIWVGEHIHYNFNTHVMRTDQFRTGHSPVMASGAQLTGYIDNRKGATNIVTARHAMVTTEDYADPDFEIHATSIRVIPGKQVQMWNAVVYVKGVPVFYFPYYQRNLGPRANNFTTTPGYRSVYGPYILNTYNWYLGDAADGRMHADYRERRGPGAGPDVNLHLGIWGEAAIKYYYQHDQRPNYSTNVFPAFGSMPENRQRFYLGWQATPATNLNVKAQVNYQSDPLFLHDFFVGDYTQNPQPNSFVEANRYWNNWSLDALTTPRINSFYSQVERLPDVKLTGYRQQLWDSAIYYDSESSIGSYRTWDANTATNGINGIKGATNELYSLKNGFYSASAARADTYHQFTVPWTFCNWLNVTPRVGGRLTYYSSTYYQSQTFTNHQPESDVYREVFNTGVGTSFKASQLWPDATNSFLQVDGLRHLIEPSANYVFVPDPSTPPARLPAFDAEAPSLMLSPVDFPDYSSIDSIDTMNVVRFGLRNLLQTKRNGQLDDLVNWNLLLDWRLDPKAGQGPLNDLYSAFAFRPRTWLTLESQLRYDLNQGDLNMSFHQATFAPNNRWSWGLAHWYLRDGFVSAEENNFIVSTLYFRVNDNWGLRAAHTFNAVDGRMQEQSYSIMRDLRSWTTALTFRLQNNAGSSADFTVAFAISLKANPSMQLGEDTVTASHRLVGE